VEQLQGTVRYTTPTHYCAEYHSVVNAKLMSSLLNAGGPQIWEHHDDEEREMLPILAMDSLQHDRLVGMGFMPHFCLFSCTS
jgi:hypothetical protein